MKLDRIGPPCRRCQQATEVYEHSHITEKLLRQDYYYGYWYRCRTAACRTNLIMPDEAKVFPGEQLDPAVAGDIVMKVLREMAGDDSCKKPARGMARASAPE